MKKTVLNKRLKELEKELADIDSNVRSLAKKKGAAAGIRQEAGINDGTKESRSIGRKAGVQIKPERADSARGGREKFISLYDRRFLDYMASSFSSSSRSLRRERSVQRNKAIITVIFLLLLIVWFIYRFVL